MEPQPHPSAEGVLAQAVPGSRVAPSWTPWLVALALLGVLVWAHWPAVKSLANEWDSLDDYSVGMLVPFAALYLLWQERDRWAGYRPAPAWIAGISLFLFAQALRAFGLIGLFESIERYALVLTVWAVVLLVGGRAIFRRAFWVLMFLFLMIPLPGRIHNMIAYPMQSWATDGALITLQALGISVLKEGHVLVLNDNVQVAIAEACSGLRMLSAFVVVAAFLAYVIERPRWERIVVLLSSLPVAVFCNLVRLVVTCLLYLLISNEAGKSFFHDFAGLTMMPLAVAILLAELWIMSKLIIEPPYAPDTKSM